MISIETKIFKRRKLIKFFYIIWILLAANFISSGRLSGDALYVFSDALKFSFNWNFSELTNLLPRRYIVFIFCLIPTQFFSLFVTENSYNELFYLLQGFLSYLTTLMWLITLILTANLNNKSFSLTSHILITFYFFCTPMIFLSNELVQENLIIFFLILFFYLEKLECLKTKILMNISLFLILILKIYFIPLIIYLLFSSNRYSSAEKMISFLLLLSLSLSIYFLLPILLEAKSTANTFYLIKSFDNFLDNLIRFLFSFNHGFFATFHIFSFIIFYFILKKKYFILFSLNIFYIFFFCLFPYWHGDMAGSRYMLPINLLNICVLLKEINHNLLIKKFNKLLCCLLIFIWAFSINCIDYDVASLNRYNDGASFSKINKKAYKPVNLFSYESFPYFSLELHPFLFASKIRWEILFLNKKYSNFYNDNFLLEMKNIYPRSIYSVFNYIHSYSPMALEFNEKYFGKFSKYYTLTNVIILLKMFSLFFIFLTPFVIVHFLRLVA